MLFTAKFTRKIHRRLISRTAIKPVCHGVFVSQTAPACEPANCGLTSVVRSLPLFISPGSILTEVRDKSSHPATAESHSLVVSFGDSSRFVALTDVTSSGIS